MTDPSIVGCNTVENSFESILTLSKKIPAKTSSKCEISFISDDVNHDQEIQVDLHKKIARLACFLAQVFCITFFTKENAAVFRSRVY